MKVYNKESVYNAKKLRKNATKEENHLWYDFLKKHKLKFVRQKVIGNYILDFYCFEIKLAIEVDGSQHFEEKGSFYDVQRTETINEYGISVLRFSNYDINRQFESVCQYIDAFISKMNSGQVTNESVTDRF